MSVGDLILQDLLGCQWGRRVKTPDDEAECQEQAVCMVVVHDGAAEMCFKLCERHHERVLQETTPRHTAYPCAVCGFAQTCGDPPGEDCHS